MSFLEEYKQKLVSADEAVKIVKSGDWVDYGWCTGTPDALDKALARRTDELKDVNVRGGILLKPLAIFEREDAGGFLEDFGAYADDDWVSEYDDDGFGSSLARYRTMLSRPMPARI